MDAYTDAAAVDAGEPSSHADPMTAQEMSAISEDRLEALGLALAERRDEWVAARAASGVEKRWLDDLDQYNGRDDATKTAASMMDSVERGFPVTNQQAKPQRSTVFVNLTRPKTNAAIARVQNMLLPTDDRNFGLHPDPVPELTKAALDAIKQQQLQPAAQPQPSPLPPGTQLPAPPSQAPGMPLPAPGMPMDPSAILQPQPQPQPVSSAAQDQLDKAAECARAMQDEIDDQLQESNYNREARLMLHDCGVLGTGVIKGPVVVSRTKKAWQPVPNSNPPVHVLQVEIEQKPATYRVSPWDFYPDPSCGDDHRSGIGAFERKAFTSKQLRQLVDQPGYNAAAISKVLEEGPQSSQNKTERDRRKESKAPLEIYDVWEYWGEFAPEDLRAAGVDVPDGTTANISGCVVLVNETVIKGFLNPLETGDLPYDMMVWEPDDNSVWGFGVPHLCRSPQRVLNAAWRQLMDNSGATVGPQIVLNPSVISPADGKWEITGRKIWNYLDAGGAGDIKQAFGLFEISSHIAEIEQIIQLAERFFDEETAVPQLAQGEHGNAPDTVGGMTILENSANVVLTRLTKHFDDGITRPHITRYVDWNMAYNPKPEIKGSFNVRAAGTSSLLVRDIQSQVLIQLGQFQGSGIIAPMVNWENWFKAVLKSQHVDPTLIMKTDAEIAAMTSQPPQATPEQIRANAQLAVAQTRANAALASAQAKVQGELAYAQTEAQSSHEIHQSKLQELAIKRELAILEYAQKHQLSLEQVKADLAKTQMQEETKRQLAAADIQMRMNESHRDHLNQQLLNQSAGQPAPPQ